MTQKDDDALRKSLRELPREISELLAAHRFDPEWLVQQAQLTRRGERSNWVTGKITAPCVDEVPRLPEPGSDEYRRYLGLGEQALRDGQCALVVLAGGMATRMGGVIKALVPALDDRTFLDLRLAEQDALAGKYGRRPPLWLMTSHATHQGIEEALSGRLTSPDLALFRQGLSVRLTPEGGIFVGDDGAPSLHAPGHGDLPSSLQASGLLKDFVAAGGRYVLVTNLDNLGGGLDPVLIGMHLAHDCAVTCEVVDKVGSDRGGIPARLEDRLVVLEEFRVPETFNPETVPVFNVNSFAFDARELLDLSMAFTYFEVQKKVDGRTAIQYERLINEVTFVLPTRYVNVPRSGPRGRFLPVKDHDELERRQSELRELAEARGMIQSS